jgi:hypothetical protein
MRIFDTAGWVKDPHSFKDRVEPITEPVSNHGCVMRWARDPETEKLSGVVQNALNEAGLYCIAPVEFPRMTPNMIVIIIGLR